MDGRTRGAFVTARLACGKEAHKSQLTNPLMTFKLHLQKRIAIINQQQVVTNLATLSLWGASPSSTGRGRAPSPRLTTSAYWLLKRMESMPAARPHEFMPKGLESVRSWPPGRHRACVAWGHSGPRLRAPALVSYRLVPALPFSGLCRTKLQALVSSCERGTIHTITYLIAEDLLQLLPQK